MTFLNSILNLYSTFNFNWLDLIIIIIFLFYAYEGFTRGFILSMVDLVSFAASFAAGLKFYPFFAKLLVSVISIPMGFSNAFGFFIGAFLTEIIISNLLKRIIKILSVDAVDKNQSDVENKLDVILAYLNHLLGIIPSLASSVILVSFLLTLIVALPFSPFLKQTIYASRISSALLAETQGIEQDFKGVFGQALDETVNFLTVEPKSNQMIKLSFKTTDFHVDVNAEKQMFGMVNTERTKRNIPALSFDARLQAVGRAHCEDMFTRGYFSHYTPEGLSPFDRMGNANISFTYAGENLAFAPNVALAMQGLMNSPGHRANILSVHFGRVGIGVIDGGIYGEMFCQEFTN